LLVEIIQLLLRFNLVLQSSQIHLIVHQIQYLDLDGFVYE
jgi:hypothetical protein